MLRIGAASSLITPMVAPGKVEFQYAELSTVANQPPYSSSQNIQQFCKYPTVLHSELLEFMSMRTPAISRVRFRFH
jgi:hypothetical protein